MVRKSFVFLLTLLIATGCSIMAKEKAQMVSDTGAILVMNNKGDLSIGHLQEISEDDLVIDFYFESNSGSAIMFYDRVKTSVKELILQHDVKIILHPLIYLNNRSEMGTSYLIGKLLNALAEKAPDYVLPFLDAVLQENNTDIDEEAMIELMQSWSFNEKQIEEILDYKEKFHQQLIQGSKEFLEIGEKDMPYIKLNQDDRFEIFKVEDISTVSEDFIKTIKEFSEKGDA